MPAAVASLVIPGEGDPAEELRNGAFSMQWGGDMVRKFREVKIPHVKKEELALPTLYLHFLHEDFRIGDGELDGDLRSGNDMSEVVVKLPAEYLTSDFAERCQELKEDVEIVAKALQAQGQLLVSACGAKEGRTQPAASFFSLKTARAKAPVTLDKKAFGIPMTAEQYLFVNNHTSVIYFNEETKAAFNSCIGGLQEVGFPAATKFALFLKVFYEGGFGYNKKIPMGRGYLPVNVGVAAMSVVPAFDGQVGIATGYPYKLSAPFVPFTETVPISIDAIRTMSEFHGRYGLAFSRVVYVWEGDLWGPSKTLDFCSILPHGGFFYVPELLSDHQTKGGLVYAFGESATDAVELSIS